MTLAEFFETHRSPHAIVLPDGEHYRLQPVHPAMDGIDFGAVRLNAFGPGRRTVARVRGDRVAAKKK